MSFFPFVSREVRPAPPSLEAQLRSLFAHVVYCENKWRWFDYKGGHGSRRRRAA